MAKNYYIADLYFEVLEAPVSVGDGKCIVKVPYDGEILSSTSKPVVNGMIYDTGAGAGDHTDAMLRNATTGRNLFATPCEYRVNDRDANGHAPVVPGTLASEPCFKAGDSLAVDIDDIPAGGVPSYVQLVVTCGFWYESS